ncbi:MAG: aminopeptidase [Saprospiraceae bacterium]|nr:aminopeptidase [Saprospiraceae bacterium]
MLRIIFSFTLYFLVTQCFSQELALDINRYHFTQVKMVDRTAVKNQFKSGTCWIYSTHSFLESELIRMGKGEHDLSEMYIARAGYLKKADIYIHRQGASSFGQGAENHDVINIIAQHGIVPQSVFSGFPEGQDKPVHGEIEAVLKAICDAMIKLPDGRLSPNWRKVFTGALDGYFGTPPSNFMYQGKNYNPQSFAENLGIKAEDYVAYTSFTHHPFYKPFVLEMSDNWSQGQFMNVKIDELVSIVDNAINNGYSVLWATDVSEKSFSAKNGLAINPIQAWEDMDEADKDSLWKTPSPEKIVTQEERQLGYDNLTTTDDHGMHIVGLVKDQKGTEYYVVKNSWGTDVNKSTAGYLYVSKAYFRNKTMSIMLHKNGVPTQLRIKN